jgi:uncharacterized protein YodC (DUF2158 family)
MEYKTGDKVQLISGGPDMTVKGIVGTESLNKVENLALNSSGHMEGDVYCQWFNNTKLEGGVFKPTMLKKL